MGIPNDLLNYINKEFDNMEYGEIIIEKIAHKTSIDIITSKRTRFDKKKLESEIHPGGYHQG